MSDYAFPSSPFVWGDALFAAAISNTRARYSRPIVVGLCGAQGSGKSTTAIRVGNRLRDAGIHTAICSLDDFYLSRKSRDTLARSVHPLLATRGVPGTHDVSLLLEKIDALCGAAGGGRTPIPRFNKAEDDRVEERDWFVVDGPVDVVLLEGWCVGARPQSPQSLAAPVNSLERDEDRDGTWRHYVNEALAREYRALFDRLDLRLMMRPPSFDCVLEWRRDQETMLRAKNGDGAYIMDDKALRRFVAHYERLTLWLIEDEPANLIADLDLNRAPQAWRIGKLADALGAGAGSFLPA